MGLLKRFFISNLIILVSVVVVMTGLGFYSLQSTIKEYAFSRIEYVTSAKANEIEKFFSQKKLIVDIIGETERIKKFVTTNDIRGLESSVDALLSKSDSFDLLLMNPKGEILYSHQGVFSGGERLAEDPSSRKLAEILSWSQRQLEPHVLLLDFEKFGRYDDKEVMFISRPLFVNGKVVSTVVLVYSLEQFHRFVKRELSKNIQDLGPSGGITIFGEDSMIRSTSRDAGALVSEMNPDGIRAVEEKQRNSEFFESKSGDSYFKSTTLARLPDGLVWYIEVSVLQKDVFRGMYHLFAGFILVMFTVISVVSLLSYYGNLKIIRPLYDVIDSIKILGTTEKPEKLAITDSYELGYLIKNYNELVDRLQWTQLSRNYFEGILESINEFVFIVERELDDSGGARFYVKQVNKSICEAFKIGRYDLVGNDLRDFLMLESTQFEQFIQGEADNFVEGQLLILGTSLPVIVKPSQVRSVGEKNYVILCHDISLQKQQQFALVRAKEEAVKASQAKSDFLAKMSHEIRTPLNVIVGMSDILKTSPDVPEDKKEMVRILSSASENLLALINDILDLSKIEAQEIKVESIPTNIVRLINEVVDILKVKAEPKGLQMNFIFDSDRLKPCYLDPTRLRQIVFNLVGNAVKFTEKGSIDIVVSSYGDDQNELLFEVRDSGIGIPRESQGMLFRSFVQADGSISRKFGGTGLGLAISKNLVELMGGKIWLQSEPGVGTSFFFTLPYKQVEGEKLKAFSAQEVESPAKVIDLSSKRKFRILVADDTEDNRVLLKAYLKGMPVDVVEAENGLEAVNLIKSGQRFDLVFIDIQMPVMDGYSATRAIRVFEKENGISRTPILALSANAMLEDFEKSKSMDCDAHLTKPIRRNEVVNAITKYAA